MSKLIIIACMLLILYFFYFKSSLTGAQMGAFGSEQLNILNSLQIAALGGPQLKGLVAAQAGSTLFKNLSIPQYGMLSPGVLPLGSTLFPVGTGTWVVPANVYTIGVCVIGGGGAGSCFVNVGPTTAPNTVNGGGSSIVNYNASTAPGKAENSWFKESTFMIGYGGSGGGLGGASAQGGNGGGVGGSAGASGIIGSGSGGNGGNGMATFTIPPAAYKTICGGGGGAGGFSSNGGAGGSGLSGLIPGAGLSSTNGGGGGSTSGVIINASGGGGGGGGVNPAVPRIQGLGGSVSSGTAGNPSGNGSLGNFSYAPSWLPISSGGMYGGGGGGIAYTMNKFQMCCGGGGGGGLVHLGNMAVVPGTSYSYQVGRGQRGSGFNASFGGDGCVFIKWGVNNTTF